jgi:very-short-patch-repair endonuclease
MVVIKNIKYELESIKLKKQIRLAGIEGDFIIKEKAKEIFNDGIKHTEEE